MMMSGGSVNSAWLLLRTALRRWSVPVHDVLAMVVPDRKTKNNIEEYLRQTWVVVPQILVYPS
jgi:hypothetical protein